jgi:hypothetical protein
VTHLRNDITDVPGITGYQQSTWIAFVTGPLVYPIGTNQIDFPVVLRALPLPPTALAQTADGSPDAATAAQLPDWDYTFSYSATRVAQDSLLASVAFNNATPAPGAEDVDPTTGLFQSLAAMIAVTPAVFADMNEYLRKVDSATDPTSTVFKNADAAIKSFVTLTGNLATAYAKWANPPPPPADFAMVSSGPPPVLVNFTVELTSADGTSTGAAVTEVIGTLPSNMPAPIIQIEPDQYTAQSYTPQNPPPNLIAAYEYAAADKTLLNYSDALNIPGQTIAFDALNGIALQKAQTAIEIQRNQDLVPNRTTADDFVFRTPPVAFATPTVPLVNRATFNLGTLITTPMPAPLSQYLGNFFTQLIGTNDAQWVLAQIQSSAMYAATGVSGGPRITVPINLMLPTPPTPDAIAALAATVTTWLEANRSFLTGPDATLDFEVILYGTLPGETRPVLKIADAFVDIAVVQ